jgi:beta-phosphoglucomutase
MAARALVFDFNGTISDDEELLFEIFRDLFAARGRPLTREDYFERLVGLSDPEIVRMWLGHDDPDVLAERAIRYRAGAGDGSTVSETVRDAVRFAAEHVPVAVVSGALRAEVEPVLEAAGIAGAIRVTVTADDVRLGKPDPEGYLRAAELLGVAASEATAFEDTEAGIAAAKAAGMRCVGVLGTLAPERLALADELAPALTVEAVRQALGQSSTS